MSTGNFDFFGGPPSAPPPPPAPTVNQFGLPLAPPTAAPSGLPPGALVAPSAPPSPASGSSAGTQPRTVALLVAGVVALGAVSYFGIGALQKAGQKSAAATTKSVMTTIDKAKDVGLQQDLQLAMQTEQAYAAEHDTYAPSTAALTADGFVDSPNVRVTVVSGTAAAYCLRADDATGIAPPLYATGTGMSATPCS